MKYQIVWNFDSDAETPEEAARDAWETLRRADSTACVFEVTDTETGATVTVDLMVF
jgi:hypothetical protein